MDEDSFFAKLQKYRDSQYASADAMRDTLDQALILVSGSGIAAGLSLYATVPEIRAVGSFFFKIALASWFLCILLVLLSYWSSHAAQRKSAQQVDEHKSYIEKPGGIYNPMTTVLNILAFLAMVSGIVNAVAFIWLIL